MGHSIFLCRIGVLRAWYDAHGLRSAGLIVEIKMEEAGRIVPKCDSTLNAKQQLKAQAREVAS